MIEKIKTIIIETIGDQYGIDAEETLADYGVDSLDAVEIAMRIEDEFGIEFGDDDIPELYTGQITVGNLAAFVERRVRDVE